MNELITGGHETPSNSRLAKSERELIEAHEAMGESFFRQGVILDRIRKDQEYKDAGFSSFDHYCNERQPCGYKRRACWQFIAAKEKRLLLPSFDDCANAQWTESTIRPLTHSDFSNADVRRLGKKIATRVKKGEPLTARLVKEICDADRGVDKKKDRQHAERVAAADTPAEALKKMQSDVLVWQSSLSNVGDEFWSDALSEDAKVLKEFCSVLRDFVSFLES